MSLSRTLIAGAVFAVAAALMVVFGEALGLDLERTPLVAGAIGAAVGLVPDRGAFARLGGLGVGFLIGYLGYALRAGVLPDTSNGRAIAAFVVVLVCVGVSAATLTRLPLWALLLGVAAMAGSYETTFMLSPADFPTQSMPAATQGLLAAAIGFAATVIFSAQPAEQDDVVHSASHRADDPTPSHVSVGGTGDHS